VMEVLISAVEGREPVSLLELLSRWPCRKAARREGHGADEGGGRNPNSTLPAAPQAQEGP
jgi:hypothetical protein